MGSLATRTLYAGARQRARHNLGNRPGMCEGSVRGANAYEHTLCWHNWPGRRDVEKQRISDVLRKWKRHSSFRFAADAELRPFPVNIFEFHGENVAGAQTEPCKQEEDRAISDAHCRIRVAGID